MEQAGSLQKEPQYTVQDRRYFESSKSRVGGVEPITLQDIRERKKDEDFIVEEEAYKFMRENGISGKKMTYCMDQVFLVLRDQIIGPVIHNFDVLLDRCNQTLLRYNLQLAWENESGLSKLSLAKLEVYANELENEEDQGSVSTGMAKSITHPLAAVEKRVRK